MDLFVLAFIKSALFHLGAGGLLGLVMALWPRGGLTAHQLLPSHAHLMLIGWLSMIVFGVAYHVLPRFSGRPLRFPRMAWAHFILSHLGLWGMVVGFFLVRVGSGPGPFLLGAGALTQAAGLALFILNLWLTLPGWGDLKRGG
jgi:cbb3-type cytochrome oxidase subunit 1